MNYANLAIIDRVPSKWDKRFLDLAKMISTWSKDPSTQTGAVIVRPDRTIASLGYNGFPRGTDDNPSLYANRELKYSRIIHCEMNAILSAREPLRGYTLYTHPFLTCDRCAVHVIQAGITRVVAPKCPDHLLERWEPTFVKSRRFYCEAGVDVAEYDLQESPVRGDEPSGQAGHEPKAEPNIQAAVGVGRRHGSYSDILRELNSPSGPAVNELGRVGASPVVHL